MIQKQLTANQTRNKNLRITEEKVYLRWCWLGRVVSRVVGRHRVDVVEVALQVCKTTKTLKKLSPATGMVYE